MEQKQDMKKRIEERIEKAKEGLEKLKSISLPGDETTKTFLQTLLEIGLKVIEVESDEGVFIVGERGTGKSTLAFSLANIMHDVYSQLGLKVSTFVVDSPSSLIAFMKFVGREENIKWLLQEYDKIILIFDEIHAYAGKREAMTVINRFMIKLLKLIRPLNTTYFLITQYPSDIDIDLRNPDFIHFLLVGLKRGEFFVYTKFYDVEYYGEKMHVTYVLEHFDRFDYLVKLRMISKLTKEFPPFAKIQTPKLPDWKWKLKVFDLEFYTKNFKQQFKIVKKYVNMIVERIFKSRALERMFKNPSLPPKLRQKAFREYHRAVEEYKSLTNFIINDIMYDQLYRYFLDHLNEYKKDFENFAWKIIKEELKKNSVNELTKWEKFEIVKRYITEHFSIELKQKLREGLVNEFLELFLMYSFKAKIYEVTYEQYKFGRRFDMISKIADFYWKSIISDPEKIEKYLG